MREERDIIQKLVEKLDVITKKDVMVIADEEYTQDRWDKMVVVGITEVTNVNPTLPDYEFTARILIDTYIKEDKEGFFHDQTKQMVQSYLETFLNDQSRLGQLFDDIPIVGMFLSGINNTSNSQSNQTFITLQIIGSW